MTISYNFDVATSSAWSFMRVILRWRASVWESVLVEFSVWTMLYYAVFALYHFVLADSDKRDFLVLGKHIDKRLDYFVISFILGFFIWKRTFDNIGFIDNVCLFLNAYVNGSDEETRLTRRAIARWLCLAQVLVLRDISMCVRRRFPSYASVVEAGIMEVEEREAVEQMDTTGFTSYWLPFNWIFTACKRLRQRGNIPADPIFHGLLAEVRAFREQMQALCNFDAVPIPLAYPQVVFLAVRAYFALCLISRQSFTHLDVKDFHGDIPKDYKGMNYYIPFMTMIQFVILMGWVKVAEALMNPMGEDEDDFECNYIIDRNITVAMLLVDKCHDSLPTIQADRLPDGHGPLYSEESAELPQHPLIGSAAKAAKFSDSLYEEPPARMVPRRSAVPNIVPQATADLWKSVSMRHYPTGGARNTDSRSGWPSVKRSARPATISPNTHTTTLVGVGDATNGDDNCQHAQIYSTRSTPVGDKHRPE